jgi:hypothetical protein
MQMHFFVGDSHCSTQNAKTVYEGIVHTHLIPKMLSLLKSVLGPSAIGVDMTFIFLEWAYRQK